MSADKLATPFDDLPDSIHVVAEGQDVWIVCVVCHSRYSEGEPLYGGGSLNQLLVAAAKHFHPS